MTETQTLSERKPNGPLARWFSMLWADKFAFFVLVCGGLSSAL